MILVDAFFINNGGGKILLNYNNKWNSLVLNVASYGKITLSLSN